MSWRQVLLIHWAVFWAVFSISCCWQDSDDICWSLKGFSVLSEAQLISQIFNTTPPRLNMSYFRGVCHEAGLRNEGLYMIWDSESVCVCVCVCGGHYRDQKWVSFTFTCMYSEDWAFIWSDLHCIQGNTCY